MKKGLFLYFLFICTFQMFAQRPTWSVNETNFENTQTMIAKLSLDGKLLESPNDMVGAFVGNECRGVASPVFIPATGKYYTYLTVFSNKQGEEITFKLYEHSSGRIVPVDKKLSFNINGHLGSFFQAYSISMPVLSSQAAMTSFDLYNVKPDSVVTKGDVRVYYVPSTISKDTISTNFTVSAGAKVFVKEVPVVSKVSKINFTKQVVFQVVSQDESTLLNYKVEVVNSLSKECSTSNIPKPSTNNVIYCLNAYAGVLSATALSGKNLLWYGTSDIGGESSRTAPIPSTTTVGETNYYVAQRDSVSGCESDRAKILVTVAAIPVKPRIANLSYCQSTEKPSLSAEALPSARLVWYGTNETGGNGSGTIPVVQYNVGLVVNYYVSQKDTLSGCEGPRAKIVVTNFAQQAPIKPVVADVSYCQFASTTSLRAVNIPGTRILWYGINATGGVGSTANPMPSADKIGDLTYYVVQQDTVSGCESDRAALKVSVLANPAKPTISLDASYNLVSSASAGNQWYKEGVLINAAVSSVYKPASNGTYTVKVTTSGCPSEMSANFNYLITAITNLAKEEFVTFSPNPVVDELRLQYYLTNSSRAYITLLDMSGRTVVDGREMAPDSAISLRELPSGLYVLRLLDSEGRLLYTQKIVKI